MAPPEAIEYGQVGLEKHVGYVHGYVDRLSTDLNLAGSISEVIRNEKM